MVKVNFVQLLNEGHSAAKGLFNQFRGANDIAQKRSLSQAITDQFVVRSSIEEKFLIPEFQKVKGDPDINFKAFNVIKKNNVALTQLLSRAERISSSEQRLQEEQTTFESIMNEVIQLSEKNLDQQTKSILSKLEKDVHPFRLEELGHDAEYHKKSLESELSHTKGARFVGNEYFIELNKDQQQQQQQQQEQKQ